ncbi:ParH-like protein [Streptomyces sp. NPDC001130]
MPPRSRRNTPTDQHHSDFRQRCAERVRILGLADKEQLTVPALCERLSGLRGRPLQVVAADLPLGSPDGLLIETQTQDFIVYEARLAPLHQQQVVLHEVGHLLCGHPTRSTHSPLLAVAELFTPSLDPGLVNRVLGRDHTDTEHEREAEYIGSLIGQRISSWSTDRTRPVPPDAQDLVARLSALESRRPESA